MPFLGMRGTGDFTVTGQRPENWREKVLELFPNGDAPLTAMLSMVGSERTIDPHFHWYTKKLSTQSATGTAGAFVYKNVDLSTAYAASDDKPAGFVVYVKMTAAQVSMFFVGHNVLLRDASDITNDIHAKVVDINVNGASSYIACKLLQADGTGTGDLSDCDTVLILGSSFSEGSSLPSAVSYEPVEGSNYTQIFKDSLELTRTALQTKLRTGEYYAAQKKETLRYHSIGQEKALIFNGPKTLSVGANGKPERTTEGLLYRIRTDAPDNYRNYVTATGAYAGKTWTQAGNKWLNESLERIFRYGNNEKLGLCGSGALLGLQELAEAGAVINITPGQKDYGINVRSWLTPFGTLHLKTHPLFSYEDTNRYGILIVEPTNIKYRFMQDTMFKSDNSWKDGGQSEIDGLKEGFLTECGWEYHHLETMGYLYGVGQDNTV